MADAGVKDASKLTVDQKNKIIAAATEAGKSIGLTVNVTKQSNGQIAVVAKDASGKVVASFTAKEVKQTGVDTTIMYVGALMMILAAGSVLVVRKVKVSNVNA